jgi:hypothetical protein
MNVTWCDEFVRLDPLKGQVIDGDGETPQAPPVRLRAARNAFAAFQLLVGPLGKNETVRVSGGVLKTSGKSRLPRRLYDVFVEWYQKYESTWYPEVCVPQEIAGGSTPALRKTNGVGSQTFAGFWVDLFVPADATPATYTGHVTVRTDAERVRVPVELEVTAARLSPDCCLDVSMNNYATVISRGWQELRDDPDRLTSAKNLRCERGVFRTAHDHRMFFHYLPYGHSGYVPPTFAPPLDGEGPRKRVVRWSDWDRHWGPYFDGRAFRRTRRGAVPVKRFYLPLNLNWPADFVKYGRPGYAAEWRAVGRQIVEHFKQKGWTGTRFDMFLNHKQRFRYFPWDTEEVRFLEDNENHRYFRTLWEGTYDHPTARPVTFDYTLGTTWTYGHDIKSDLNEFVDVYIAGTSGITWDFDWIPKLHKKGRQVWSCTNSGSIPTSPRAPFFVPLQMWMLDIDGFMPRWCTTGGFGPDQMFGLADKGATTFLYSGAALDSEETFASLRMKVQRQALQVADELQGAADHIRGGKRAVQRKVDKTLGIPHVSWLTKKPDYADEKLPKDWVGADFATEEPPVAGWEKFSTEQFRAVRALAADLAARYK